MTPEIAVEPAAHRVARHVRDVDLTEYQAAIRTLFALPFVRPGDAPRLGLLRKWEANLREDLEAIGRYRLDVTTTSARLTGRAVVLDSTRPARTANDARRPFDARRYAYLCLVTAGLLSAGSQVLLSDLGRRLSDDAFEIDGLGFDADVFPQRTAFVDVVRWLLGIGALRLRDGSADADLDQDALYDVEHDVVHAIAPSIGLRDLQSIGDRLAESFGESRDERRLQIRQRTMRWLLDRSFLLFADLEADELAWIQRNGARIEADLHRLTGLQVERRKEGIALIDIDGDGSIPAFPRGGSAAQLALLLGDALVSGVPPTMVSVPSLRERSADLVRIVDRARPITGALGGDAVESSAEDRPVSHPQSTESEPLVESVDGSGPPPASPGWPISALGAVMEHILAAHRGVRKDVRDAPAEAVRLAIEELVRLDLVRIGTDDTGAPALVAMPVLARYRVTSSAAGPSANQSVEQPGLFASLAEDAP